MPLRIGLNWVYHLMTLGKDAAGIADIDAYIERRPMPSELRVVARLEALGVVG